MKVNWTEYIIIWNSYIAAGETDGDLYVTKSWTKPLRLSGH